MKRFAPTFVLILFLFPPDRLPAYDRRAWMSYPNMNHVTSLAEGDGEIYVGTTGGIRRYDRFGERWLPPLTTLDGLPDNRVQRLFFDPDTGDLWFTTPAGTGRWMSRLEVLSLAGLPPDGLNRARPSADIPPVFAPFGYYLQNGRILGPHQNYDITDVLIDSWRILWVGTWGLGVGRADLRNEQLHFHPFGPLDGNVTAIARDDDAIWFGGEDSFQARAQGITRYRPASGAWEYFDPDRTVGLEDAQVSAILPDTADVWFGTPSGIARYNRVNGRWVTYLSSRLRLGRVTALARDGHRLWVGAEDGLAVLDLPVDELRRVEGSERVFVFDLHTGREFVWAATDHGLFRCAHQRPTWVAVGGADGLTANAILGVSTFGGNVWAAAETPPALVHLAPSDSTWRRFPLPELSGNRRVAIAADGARVWVGTAQGASRLNVARELWARYTQSDGLLHDRVQAVLLDGESVWFGTAGGVSQFHWQMDFFERD